jgi:hypothetical protein
MNVNRLPNKFSPEVTIRNPSAQKTAQLAKAAGRPE